ncbi:hypothetical protein OIDMADRAFT_186023 [Oidiodendron maius Zn]|uniref:Ubiquitin carboxyl-terminal hydrolase 19 n=1 Tax=Oidiodendron maius (strain Zn) TaxID=913774 RepID=A0A0C3HWX1_OIDMZ|nr:hypothetical protein OIDMADRAFT_186023 [Oidiodendron maius Zn]
MDLKHVQAVQSNHADRLMRLEKRQADDAALKSVWGNGSLFPSVLSPVQNPPTVFDDFDDEQGHNLLGSLQLEADEEPVRRGASRANSVRFDVSALQSSSWTQGSRNSGEFGPVRPSSGFGSHPMTERSLSHKSDGRQSSAHSVHSMHSVPSGRTSSLGLDTNFLVSDQNDESPIDIVLPPPGLFILGSVPSIIRCWLTTNFSHAALLYGVVCTGSQKSVLDYSLVEKIGLADQVQKSSTGRNTIRLPIYLPEAIVTHPSSRSNSPPRQLPTLTTEFEIMDWNQCTTSNGKTSIQVFLGSDTLRAHNADILFSQNVMTLYGDDHNKVSVPFVRPEDENLFKDLCTTNIPADEGDVKSSFPSSAPLNSNSQVEATPATVSGALRDDTLQAHSTKSSDQDQRNTLSMENSPSTFITLSSEITDSNNSSRVKRHGSNGMPLDAGKAHQVEAPPRGSDISDDANPAEVSHQESSGGIWGSWRSAAGGSENGETTSGYQRPTRGASGRNMKVLKPSKSNSSVTATSRSSSSARTGASYEPAPPRTSGEARRKSQAGGNENISMRWDTKRVSSEDHKAPKVAATLSKTSNPVGGASAFAWMNSSKAKASASSE